MKVGDRVKYTGDFSHSHKGLEGVVTNADQPSNIHVRFDTKTNIMNDGCWGVFSENLTVIEPARPRFMTAWLDDSDDTFHPTGDAFMTLDAAQKFAIDKLTENAVQDQIAVFEIRSVHLARLTVSSEAA